MTRRTLLVLALVLSLSLAGCSALPMWDEGSSDAERDGVPTADPGGEGGSGPDVQYPDGYGPNGVEAPDEAMSNHLGTLHEVDGYSFTYDSLVTEGDAETATGIVHHADNVDEVGYEIQNRADGSVVTYFEDDHVYTRIEQDGEVRYNATAYDYKMSRFTGYQFIGPLLAQVEYKDAEVVETEEGTFYHYVSEEVLGPAEVLRSDVDEDRIERFDVAIVVDDDGVVRHANFVVEADRNVTVTMNVDEINSTNVERPDWYDEAKNS
jgi:hypothetical protein